MRKTLLTKFISVVMAFTLRPSLTEVEGTPQQIEGPYFVDEMPNRSDIRLDTSDGSVQEGIPLHLILHVYDLPDDNGSCIPLSDAKVDIWHANSKGVYSGFGMPELDKIITYVDTK
jgi:protocatechuate 3,4-dioxygenase beta subunit